MKSYDKVAWCTELSPDSQEFFAEMKEDGIGTAVVCIAMSGAIYQPGMHQTYAARAAGMNVHAMCITDLAEPHRDACRFAERLNYLAYTDDVRLAIMPMPDENLEEPEQRIQEMFDVLHEFRPKAEVDVVLTKEQVLNGEINLDLLPAEINLTIANPRGMNAGVKEAGTWIYASFYHDQPQLLSYDFYQFYSRANQNHGFQLDLDTHYEARVGDSWWVIAKQHGMRVLDLLELNEADIADRIIPGQRIRVAK